MADLADQLKPLWRVGDDLNSGSLQRQALNKAAYEIKLEALKQMGEVVGSDLQMRNYPRGKKAKLRKAGFGYELHGDTSATLNFRPGGFWRIVENGTTTHSVGAKGRQTTKKRYTGVPRKKDTLKLYVFNGNVRVGYPTVKGSGPKGEPGAKTVAAIPEKWEDAFYDQLIKRLK